MKKMIKSSPGDKGHGFLSFLSLFMYGASDQVMDYFSLAKITRFFVAYMEVGNWREQGAGAIEDFANSSLLPSIFALNQAILSHRKINPDLIRGSV